MIIEISNIMISTKSVFLLMLVTKCPYGGDPNTVCDCGNAPGWVKGVWPDPWCYGGKCYSGIAHVDCTGKDNGHPLGDGTWCYDGRRDTECPAVAGKMTYFIKRTFTNNKFDYLKIIFA